jgi:hypothetical protein
MNIFFLDQDPRQCAEWMVDRHVVKMILETAQLLSTAHRVHDGEEVIEINPKGRRMKRYKIKSDNRDFVLYKATHINHPSALWARESVENYNWLFDHLIALGDEYTHRYGKKHKVFGELSFMLGTPPHHLTEWDWTIPPSAMDAKYIISDDPVINYRNYYKLGKSKLHSWKNRQPPEWIS